VALGVTVLYVWLPVDGATGDLESFASEGYRVQWLLEERKGGLQIGDVIVRAGGYTPEEWLRGVPRGAEWRNGEVTYQIVRDGKPVSLDIQLSPVPLEAILTLSSGHLGLLETSPGSGGSPLDAFLYRSSAAVLGRCL
jgi:hypothetical protein